MNKNNTFQEIWSKIKDSKKVLMSLHTGPDGDSLASCVAMKYVLERDFNCSVRLVSKDNLGSILSELPYVNEVEFGVGIDELDLDEFDVVLLMDSGAIKQFAGRDKSFSFSNEDFIVNIDHHATNEYFGTLNYVDHRPSACSVLLDLFRAVDVQFDSELATRLLLGIYTDSGYFSHDNGVSILDAAFLIEQGADYLHGIVNKIKYNYPLKLKKYYALLYDNFKIVEVNGCVVGYSSVSFSDIEKLGLNLSEVRGGINDLQEIGGLDMLFTLTEVDGRIKGSFRTRKNIDVSLLAHAFGGGGHKQAAAFYLENMPLEEAERKVLEKIEELGVQKAY